MKTGNRLIPANLGPQGGGVGSGRTKLHRGSYIRPCLADKPALGGHMFGMTPAIGWREQQHRPGSREGGSRDFGAQDAGFLHRKHAD